MPIVRRSEPGDRLAPRVLYLWNRKWWIIIPTIVMFFLTYFLMLFVKQDFAVSSEVYVNRLAVFQDNQASPQTVAALAKSDALLYRVREEFLARFKGERAMFEKFGKQFRVKQETLQDTTVNKEFSPVLQLTVTATGREETRFLMQTWTRLLVEMYGNFATTEARLRLEQLQREDDRLDAELRSLEAERAQAAAELPAYRKLLAEQLDLLAPADLKLPEAPSVVTGEQYSSNVTMQLAVEQAPQNRRTGLLADLANAQLELYWLQATEETTAPAITELEIEVGVLNRLAAEAQTSATGMQVRVADLQQKFETASRQIDVKRSQQRELHRFMDQIAAVAALYREPAGDGHAVAGDLRVLSSPILPELRVWPKRTLTALIVAIATFVICLAALMAYRSLRETARMAINERRLT
jgi:hypothetical protein